MTSVGIPRLGWSRRPKASHWGAGLECRIPNTGVVQQPPEPNVAELRDMLNHVLVSYVISVYYWALSGFGPDRQRKYHTRIITVMPLNLPAEPGRQFAR